MLTADLVRARKKNGELVLRPLSARERARALEIAAGYLAVARSSIGERRFDLEAAWDSVPITAREKRLADGLRKLVDDAVVFEARSTVDPVRARSDVFLAASAARRHGNFDRAATLDAVARCNAVTPEDLEHSLYADLRSEERLTSVPALSTEQIVARYDHGQVQAVLLRAVRVVADVRCATPLAYRALFRQLKFRRLLHRISPAPAGGHRIEIDGPFSLFESVTKYGLELALALPALEACDELTLVAEIRWGKDRTPLAFRHEKQGGTGLRSEGSPRLRDDVAALVDSFARLASPWRVAEASEVLDLPGIGVCIPDLLFERPSDGRRVHFEALGFWSRDAVWKRIELARQGLSTPVLFAVSSRLRVSEQALPDDVPSALYVYKGTMSPRAILQKLEALANRE